MSEEKQIGLLKTVLFASMFVGGVILGDQVQPIQRIQDTIRYYNVSAEDGTPQDFMNYDTKIHIDEKGRAELYFGSEKTQNYRLVNEDGTVGTLGGNIDEYFQEQKENITDWYQGIKKRLKN